jgi:UDP-N-acetylmuramoylalanine--D-glutamate ligase
LTARPASGGRFSGERALVVGAGVAGIAAAQVLAEEGASVRVTEMRPRGEIESAGHLERLGVALLAGGHDPSHLDGATLVVSSPGVPMSAPVLAWARERGIALWGELELGARLAGAPYVAVTGTNGKTTTTGMIASCLRASGLDAVACGNIGHPFPLAARQGHDLLVVEASSFQLRLQESFRPRVSVLLNLSPDHLDEHGSFDAYVESKARVLAGQGPRDTHVGNRDDARAAELSSRAPCPVVWFRLDEPDAGEVGFEGAELVARIEGDHRLGIVDGERAGYRADAAAAAAASLALGARPEGVRRGLATFEPSRHRGEVVAIVDGVRFVDNSKATNVHAALAALDGVRAGVLIAGGRSKGVDLSPLRTRADRLAAVVAIGEAAEELARVFEGAVHVRTVATLEEAVRSGLELATPHGTVLLAPACASWDMFKDYAERGDRFAAAARSLMEGATAGG